MGKRLPFNIALGEPAEMNEKLTTDNTRVTIEEIRSGQGKTDWKGLRAMTEEEVEQAAKSDPDAQLTEREHWKNAKMMPPLG